ncbi:carbohydrate-binding protein [Corynebacterium urealyticum]|uniref:carbohydrate-binding protein n=1 Tax=Corynebacterium urealyticum TaxID=43771 RepID=UPI0011E7ABB5|nr:carbohydrate-binding protein [Corynebacterium urealyticum]TYR15637.1 hypothetical protein FYJ89_03670 [Corynebacterium urealyticum]TYR17973.1 hypothetical protein FYJ88_03870 [Corynebacterium urealyticum]
MTTIYDQIRALPDTDFRELKTWVITEETTRRAQEPAVRAGQQEIIAGLQDSGVIPKPEFTDTDHVDAVEAVPEWLSPGNDHAKMYPSGAVVRVGDRVYESRVDLNSWQPGGAGVDDHIWLDITHRYTTPEPEDAEEPGTAEVIPFAPGIDVETGDIVEHQGNHYRVISPHTTASHWPPNEASALFEKL